MKFNNIKSQLKKEMIKRSKSQTHTISIELFIKVFCLSIFLVLLLLLPIHVMALKELIFNKSSIQIETSSELKESDDWQLGAISKWGETSKGDSGEGIVVDGLGNIYVTGHTSSYGADSSDVLLLKYDSFGALQWNKTWGGSSSDKGYGIAVDIEGNIYITGHTNSYGAGSSDVFLLRYNPFGAFQWSKTWGGSSSDIGYGIAIDGSGNIYITGNTRSYGAGWDDVFLLKYDSFGALQWNKTWGDIEWDVGRGIAVDGAGNVYITGYTTWPAFFDDIILLKYDSSGNLQWSKTYSGGKVDIGNAITIDGAGNIYITGGSYVSAGSFYVYLLKCASSGKFLWCEAWEGSLRGEGYGIAIDGAGNIYIMGNTQSNGAGSSDVFLLKCSSDGTLFWRETWGGTSGGKGSGIAIDGTGNIYIVGGSGGDVILLELLQAEKIPGYDIILLLSMVGLISAVYIQKYLKKRNKTSSNNPPSIV